MGWDGGVISGLYYGLCMREHFQLEAHILSKWKTQEWCQVQKTIGMCDSQSDSL